jgi:hypothetical protein
LKKKARQNQNSQQPTNATNADGPHSLHPAWMKKFSKSKVVFALALVQRSQREAGAVGQSVG